MAAVELRHPDHLDRALHPPCGGQTRGQDQVVEAEKRILSQLESSGITDQRLSDLSFYYIGLIVVCCRYVAALKKV